MWGGLVLWFLFFVFTNRRYKTSVEEVTTVVEIARELALEADPEDGTEWLPSQEKTGTNEWLLTDERGKWFPS